MKNENLIWSDSTTATAMTGERFAFNLPELQLVTQENTQHEEKQEPLFFVRKADSAKLLLIAGEPTLSDLQRGEPFSGNQARLLKTIVLDMLGLNRNEISMAWCDGSEESAKQLADHIDGQQYAAVASLTNAVRFEAPTHGERFAFNLPELQLVTQENTQHHTEMTRKLRALSKTLESKTNLPSYGVKLAKGGTPDAVSVAKSNAPKQIVYGVVLDPYTVDAQNDWIPPAEVENTAHEFLKKSRFVSYQHAGPALGSQVVESFIEPYPSKTDYMNALENKPHRAYARKFGDETLHSGAWVLGVQLSDEAWKQYESGELGAFSIEGLGVREPVSEQTMPKVSFVEIEVKK